MTTGNRIKLVDDPRWQRLQTQELYCPGCARPHRGLMDLASNAPEPWDGSPEHLPNSAAAESTHVLTEDFCINEGRDYFIRCVLQLPIVGSDDEWFGFGVWSTLSETNFRLYQESFDSGDQGSLGPWFGWFSNRLKGYPDTLFLKCQVHPQDGRQRPFIELEESDHLLAVEQRDGITLDRILEIYALNGHDLRPALLD